ncbi:MAG: TetR/AcrR family transcriptional regulator [Bryobacterales bacterium]|nr:TetR/AcrR family transcriptional regulator [Bryobacterales bacterium]
MSQPRKRSKQTKAAGGKSATKRGAGGNREPLNRERILRAALVYADRHGVDSLSMRKLGELLRVEAMSLYKHVANKDAILEGIVDLVAAEMETPLVDGDWKAEMRKRAQSMHAVLMRHPWATQLMVSRVNVGPAMLRYVDATVGCLRHAGFSIPLADHAWNALDSYVYGFTLVKFYFPVAPEDYGTKSEEFLPSLPGEEYPHLREMAEEVVGGRHDGINSLEWGLDVLLDGLEAKRATKTGKRARGLAHNQLRTKP